MTTPREKSEKRSRQRKKRCRFCGELFDPDHRVGSRQVACSGSECQQLRKQASQERWLAERPDYFQGRYSNTKRWLEAHPGYLGEYRRRNPEKVRREREQRRVRRQKAREARADIQDSIALEPSVTKSLRAHLPALPGADIQDSIIPQVVTTSLFSVHYLWRRYTRLDRLTAPSTVVSSTLTAAVPEYHRPDDVDPRRASHEENARGEETDRLTASALPAAGGF